MPPPHSKAYRHSCLYPLHILHRDSAEAIGKPFLVDRADLLQQDDGHTFEEIVINDDVCGQRAFLLHRGDGRNDRSGAVTIAGVVL